MALQVLLFPDVSKPTVTVNLTFFVGSRHEGYGEAGMAHLLEHMLFKGTPSSPCDSSGTHETRSTVQRNDMARPHELLRNAVRQRRESGIRDFAGG
jgi:predicted Zn-dependent peptidase